MTEEIDLNIPPFPAMRWDECEWWEGCMDLLGSSVALIVTPYDPTLSRLPSEPQRQALAFYLEHRQETFAAILAALQPYYEEIRPAYLIFLEAEADTRMPAVQSVQELISLIDLRQVHVHPWVRENIGYVGFQFGCSWDQEHGVGVLMHRDRVVAIGHADVSFAHVPDER